MQQIKKKKYPDSLHGYTGNLLMVAINYDKKSKSISVTLKKLYNDSLSRGMFSTAQAVDKPNGTIANFRLVCRERS